MVAVRQLSDPDPARLCLDRAYQYADDIRSGAIVSGKYVRLAVDRWFRDLETGHERGLRFDENAAARIFRFIGRYCRHYQGDWAGQIIDLAPWQCFIVAQVFGWLREDGSRRFRTVYEEIARKNGKTTKLASIGGYLVAGDNEPGAKVYSAATKRDQAKEIFESIVKMVRKDPTLRGIMKPYRNHIDYPATDSRVELLSADYNSMDGFNVHGGLVDEVHAHKDSGIWDVLESGRGARRQPLMWGITTSGFNQNSFCYELRGYAVKVLEQTVDNDAMFAIVFTLDEDDDWTDEACWIKANPNLGISVSLDDLREQCEKAQHMSSALTEFKTKRLNMWVYAETVWMNMERWNRGHLSTFNELDCWQPELCSELDGMTCYGGLDLASVEDMSALALVFTMPDGKRRFIARAYLPETAFDTRIEKGGHLRSLYQQFRTTGLLVITPGEVCDYGFIQRDILAACERFDVREIGFDRFNSSQLVSDLLEEGVPMIAMGQGVGSINAPMKEMLRLVLAGEVEHNNLVLTFAMSNVVANTNAAGDIKYDKSKISEKIDPAVAAIMALGRLMVLEEVAAPSIYEETSL